MDTEPIPPVDAGKTALTEPGLADAITLFGPMLIVSALDAEMKRQEEARKAYEASRPIRRLQRRIRGWLDRLSGNQPSNEAA